MMAKALSSYFFVFDFGSIHSRMDERHRLRVDIFFFMSLQRYGLASLVV